MYYLFPQVYLELGTQIVYLCYTQGYEVRGGIYVRVKRNSNKRS